MQSRETRPTDTDFFFANGHTHIKLKLEGERLSVFVGTAGDEENTSVFDTFIHMNSAIYALFPKITIDKNSTVTLHQYAGVAGFSSTAVDTQLSLNTTQMNLALDGSAQNAAWQSPP